MKNTAKAYVEKVQSSHYNPANNAWDKYALTKSLERNGAVVTCEVTTNSFSPFGTGIYTPVSQPTPSYSSLSRQTGYTFILPEAEVTPTPTPVVTQAPLVNPTTQPTQSSPAPFVGLIAGLGAAAAVILRRK